CDRLGLVRLLRHRLPGFSRLRQTSRSLLVRLTDGAFRTDSELLAAVQRNPNTKSSTNKSQRRGLNHIHVAAVTNLSLAYETKTNTKMDTAHRPGRAVVRRNGDLHCLLAFD